MYLPVADVPRKMDEGSMIKRGERREEREERGERIDYH
jgi:hypothetical protein